MLAGAEAQGIVAGRLAAGTFLPSLTQVVSIIIVSILSILHILPILLYACGRDFIPAGKVRIRHFGYLLGIEIQLLSVSIDSLAIF